MPELPEVETVVAGLRSKPVLYTPIAQTKVWWPRSVLPNSTQEFSDRLLGTAIQSLARRGKYLIFALTRNGQAAGILQGHLRMTGKFFVVPAQEEPLAHERIAIVFHNGQSLRFCDPRKFGRLAWMASDKPLDRELGLEPLQEGFSLERFRQILSARARALKPLLLDQKVIAGLGNIYVDESLWLARLHPLRRSDSLSDDEVRALYEAIGKALRRGLEWGGTSLGQGLAYFQHVNGESGKHQEQLEVFRRTGEPCRRCGTPIARSVVAQRGTHTCPRCQKPPRRR